MKILDVKVDKDHFNRWSMELVSEGKTYVIADMGDMFQVCINSSIFIYFMRLEFNNDQMKFMVYNSTVGLINCIFPDPKIKMIIVENFKYFNKEKRSEIKEYKVVELIEGCSYYYDYKGQIGTTRNVNEAIELLHEAKSKDPNKNYGIIQRFATKWVKYEGVC